MKVSLLVIRCKDIETSKGFYEGLGLSFVKEKHGNGPTHYSCEHDGCVFELYPNNAKEPKDNNRIGFKVLDTTKIIKETDTLNSYEFNGKTIYVLNDPDGRKVEISD